MQELQTEKKEKTTPIKKKSERLYWAKVAVVGPSGTGKSYMTKTADRKRTGYINSEDQPLPYKQEPFKFEGRPKTWSGFIKCLTDYGENPEIENIIIDSQTMAFQTLNREAKKNFQNWDVPKHYNTEVDRYLVLLKGIQKDIIIFSHDEVFKMADGNKQRRMVVHNKEYEGKIEQHYVIVLFSGMKMEDKKPSWYLRTFEEDTSSKTPEGMFPDKEGNNLIEIPNDAKYIFDCVSNYYSI